MVYWLVFCLGGGFLLFLGGVVLFCLVLGGATTYAFPYKNIHIRKENLHTKICVCCPDPTFTVLDLDVL